MEQTEERQLRPGGKGGKGLRRLLHMFGIFVLVILYGAAWAYIVHEPAHYIAGTILGKSCAIGFPPRVDCEGWEGYSAEEHIPQYLAPYFVDLALIVYLSGTKNKMIRLIPYTAFFDIQLNLTNMLLENALFGLQGGDGLRLVSILEDIAPGYVLFAFLLICAIIAVSWVVFYRRYRHDFISSEDRSFYRIAFAMCLLNMLINLLTAYLVVLPLMQRMPKG